MGIFNAAFIGTGEIHASRTAAAMQFSEHAPVSRREEGNEYHPFQAIYIYDILIKRIESGCMRCPSRLSETILQICV